MEDTRIDGFLVATAEHLDGLGKGFWSGRQGYQGGRPVKSSLESAPSRWLQGLSMGGSMIRWSTGVVMEFLLRRGEGSREHLRSCDATLMADGSQRCRRNKTT